MSYSEVGGSVLYKAECNSDGRVSQSPAKGYKENLSRINSSESDLVLVAG
jgi:hypothetical protein